MLPSFVTFDSRSYSDHNLLTYGVWNYEDISSIYVKGYKNGIVTIEAYAGTPIQSFAEFVAGIFHPESNFVLHMSDMYHFPKESFRGVQFVFNRVHLTVTKENADAKQIYETWKKQLKMLNR